jgi:hypothetical protein
LPETSSISAGFDILYGGEAALAPLHLSIDDSLNTKYGGKKEKA